MQFLHLRPHGEDRCLTLTLYTYILTQVWLRPRIQVCLELSAVLYSLQLIQGCDTAERMHLLTFMQMKQPGPLFRGFVLLTQVGILIFSR